MNQPRTVSPKRKTLLLLATGIIILAAVIYAIWWFAYGSHFESTDDAYVNGNLVQITPRVMGTVTAIEADDTDVIKAGETIVKLDPTDLRIALDASEANLAQTVRRVSTLYVQNDSLAANVDVRRADIERAQADLQRAQSDYKRREELAKSGGVSGEEILHAQTALKSAESGLAQARASLAAAQAQLQTNLALTRNTTPDNHPDVLNAESQVRNAWLNLTRANVPSPVSGMVARRSVQVGQRVSPGDVLMNVVPLNEVWIDANFKETQLSDMRVGQAVTVVSDLYGGKVTYHGTVEGVDAGTGSAFALLPAQNATGNWIKIVQRIPVRIQLDPNEVAKHPLRIGLSMTVEVDVADQHGQNLQKLPASQRITTEVFDHSMDQANALIANIVKTNLAQ